jgi:hypothetical protein
LSMPSKLNQPVSNELESSHGIGRIIRGQDPSLPAPPTRGRGEEITITKHGKPVARLVPFSAARPAPDVRAAVAAMKQFRKGRSLGGPSIRDMIEEGRRF